MSDLFKVYTPSEARTVFYQQFCMPSLKKEIVCLQQSLGRVLAQDVQAPENIPAFDRSSMDGYAVRAQDTFGASESLPAYLIPAGEILMGEEAQKPVHAQQAIYIPTGGMLPPDADAVVMKEYTTLVGDDLLEVVKSVGPGENVVKAGDDVGKGQVVLSEGHTIRSQDLGAFASLGIVEAAVYERPRIAIISTGDELVSPEKQVKVGQVRDINAYTLYAQVMEAGGMPVHMGIVRDNFAELKGKMTEALQEYDMVLISGGSSVGTRDVTVEVLESLGEPGVLVHGVSVSPGKPTIMAISQNKPVFGLPGHPVAAMTIFDLFVEEIICKLQGKQEKGLGRKSLKGELTRNVPSSPGREDYLRVAITAENGTFQVHPILGKSGLIFTMVKAQGIVKIPIERAGLEKGEQVTVRLF